MVAGPSVGELVIEDIMSTLRTIDGPPAFAFDVSNAVHQNGQPLNAPSLPAIFVFDDGQIDVQSPGQRVPNGLVSVSHSFSVVGVVHASQDGWQADVRRLLVDAATVLRQTWTRGGNALITRVDEAVIDDVDPSSMPFGIGAIRVVIVYRHQLTEPTQAF